MISRLSGRSLRKHFDALPDPRDARIRRHLLVDIVVIAICWVLSLLNPEAIGKCFSAWIAESLTTDTTGRLIAIDGKTLRRSHHRTRGHWAIENSLHWVLDVTFNEDQSRTRDRKLAQNLAALRRLAISLLKKNYGTPREVH